MAEVILRVAPDTRRAEAWSFVLEAVGIPHRFIHVDEGMALVVDDSHAARAVAALTAQEREAAEDLQREPAAPDQGPTTLGAALATALLAFFFVTGTRALGHSWFAQGSAIAELIVHGAWYRAVTALTLHADLAHVMGNAIALIIFVSALGRWLGRGVALTLVLLSGIIGNLITAYAYGANHDSVGASTAAFGALGLLGGLQIVRKYRGPLWLDRRRRMMTVVAACLGLFAMLGVGEKTDVVAHLAGLASGLVLGLTVGKLQRTPIRASGQWLLTALSVAVVVGSWLVARRIL